MAHGSLGICLLAVPLRPPARLQTLRGGTVPPVTVRGCEGVRGEGEVCMQMRGCDRAL